jgi:hypothetical protein
MIAIAKLEIKKYVFIEKDIFYIILHQKIKTTKSWKI